MFCKKCGKQIKEGSKFCPYCGTVTNAPKRIKKIESNNIEDISEKTEVFDNTTVSNNNVSNSNASNNNKINKKGNNASLIIPIVGIAIIVLLVTSYFLLFKQYSINYINVDRSVNNNPISYKHNDKDLYFTEPKMDGYRFKGWYEDAACSRKVNGIKHGSFGKVTVYAKWEEEIYTINYEVNGGNNNLNPTTYTVNSSTITLQSPSKIGYRFKGWLNKTTGSYVSTINSGSTGNLDLVAQWDVMRYTITYHDVKGINTNPTSYNYGDYITLKDCTDNKGYSFDGWYLDIGYTKKKSNINSTDNQNLNLYAKWTKEEYSITYDYKSYGNHTVYNPTTYNVDSYFSLNSPVSDGQTFVGWYDRNGTRISSITRGTTGDLYLTARWNSTTYSIYYSNTYGQLNTNPTIYTVEDEIIKLTKLPDRDGYNFIGWYTSNGYEKTEINAVYDKSITLTAKWEAVQ